MKKSEKRSLVVCYNGTRVFLTFKKVWGAAKDCGGVYNTPACYKYDHTLTR